MRFIHAMWSRWPRQCDVYQSANRRRHRILHIRLHLTNPYHRTEGGRRFAKEHGL